MARDLRGHWRVRRISGLLPPGVTKEIGEGRGRTLLLGIPVGRFHVEGDQLVYDRWPVVDEIQPAGGGFVGQGRLFGWRFCRFRLEPAG